jgi:hypothetical protein
MKPKKWTSKNNCPDCNVQTGSTHSKTCPRRYVLPPKAKQLKENKKLKTKLKNFLHILIS